MKLLFLFSILAPALLRAGETQIKGIVLDPAARPVADASVDCGGVRTSTRADGIFVVNGVERCAAVIWHEGFEKLRADLTAGGENRLRLSISRLSDGVVVSATRAPVSLEESGVSATVLNRAEIEARQTPAVLDLLRDIPGFAVVESGRRGAVTSLFTRGATSTGTLVLLDGVPLNEPGGQIDLAHLVTPALERIEAVRGPESALFGAEAASGVVQLFTARGTGESAAPHGRLSYERGNFQTDHWTAGISGVLSRIDYSLTADQFHTVGMFVNDFYRNTNGTANIGVKLTQKTELRAIYRQFSAEGGSPNQVAYGIFDRDSEGATRDSTLAVKLEDVRNSRFAQRISFGYHRLHSTLNDSILDGPYNVAALLRNVVGTGVYLDRLVPYDYPASQVPVGETISRQSVTLYPFPSSSETDRKSIDYQGTLAHTGGTLVFGYEYERQQGLISLLDVNRSNNGGYVHEQYRWGKRVYLTGGARLEHSSTFGAKFTPRGSITVLLAGEHGILNSTYLRFSAGRGITEPSLLQNFAQEGFYVGNPALRPEKTTSYDLGLVQEVFRRRVRLEATAFRNSFEDLIVFDFGTNPASWRNVDRSWGRGVEFSATVRPMKALQVSANWTHLETKITRTDSLSAYASVGQPLLRRPGNSGAAWLLYSPRRWNLIAGGRWVGDRQDSDFLFGITRNPAYGTMYFAGSFQVNRHFAPYFRLDNALDERYSEVLGYTALGRNGVGGVRVTW